MDDSFKEAVTHLATAAVTNIELILVSILTDTELAEDESALKRKISIQFDKEIRLSAAWKVDLKSRLQPRLARTAAAKLLVEQD